MFAVHEPAARGSMLHDSELDVSQVLPLESEAMAL